MEGRSSSSKQKRPSGTESPEGQPRRIWDPTVDILAQRSPEQLLREAEEEKSDKEVTDRTAVRLI